MAKIEEEFLTPLNGATFFLGSSLGGYYALYFNQKFGAPVALVNPAVKIYELLEDYLGENVNLYTGEKYLSDNRYMQELPDIEKPSNNVKNALEWPANQKIEFFERTLFLWTFQISF